MKVQGQRGPVIDQSTVMMTGDKFSDGLNQLVKLGKAEQYLWKIPLVLCWEVSSHCIVVKLGYFNLRTPDQRWTTDASI